jgi:1-acyl-sn-glycerol-3-phosphate acyltransferase
VLTPSKLRGAWRLARLVLHLLRGWLTIRWRFPGWSQARRDRAVQDWSQAMLVILGLQLRIEGQLLQQGPLMLVCNHISWLDIAILHAAVHCRFISKDDIRGWPVLGTLASGGATLYISRASRRDALRVVHQMAQALRQGDVLALFPEGTTGDGSTVLPFHANLLQAAIAADAPVQALGLRFEDAASGAPSFAPCYVGDETLLDSAWRTVCAPPLCAVLRCAPVQSAQGRQRREFASALRDTVIGLRTGS